MHSSSSLRCKTTRSSRKQDVYDEPRESDIQENDADEFDGDEVEMLNPPDRIRITIENHLPKVNYEPTKLLQILQNLIGNAIQYNDKKSGEIRIGAKELPDAWEIYVADNGPGIPDKFRESIFDLFGTVKSTTDTENSGIGLSTCKKIVETYGGQIWVESDGLTGSTFCFTIPKEHLPKTGNSGLSVVKSASA